MLEGEVQKLITMETRLHERRPRMVNRRAGRTVNFKNTESL